MPQLFINGTRKAVLTFRDSMGLFWFDRYKALAEAALNLVLSILLVRQYQTLGVFIGTFLSTILTSVWVEPFVLYRRRLHLPVHRFYLRYLFVCGLCGSGMDCDRPGLRTGRGKSAYRSSHPAATLWCCPICCFYGIRQDERMETGVGAPAAHRVGQAASGRNVMRQQMEEEQWDLCRLLDAALHGRPAEMLRRLKNASHS